MLKLLIGTGGATIKSLQATHNVQIAVPSERNSEICCITLIGSAEEVVEARQVCVCVSVCASPELPTSIVVFFWRLTHPTSLAPPL
jgi:rRNA processing protein Krr1/Pno1